jgi:hypothetical protein
MKLHQLNESVTVLIESRNSDIDNDNLPIENADKVDNKELWLLDTYTVSEKIDGIKLILFRNSEKWVDDYSKNWIVSYKHQILYGNEFKSVDRDKTKKYSVGISQYAFIFDHLESVHKKTKSIPPNTEIFCEFVQNKLTTTRDYKNKHGIFIIGYAPASYEVAGGMLKTKRKHGYILNGAILEKYAAKLSLKLPPVLFEGSLGSVDDITKGIANTALKKIWNNNESDYESQPYETVKKTFLELDSSLGGKSEGVVLINSDGKKFKFVQSDQYNKSVRYARKVPYQSDNPDIESQYWGKIKTVSNNILKEMDYDLNHLLYEDVLNTYHTEINNLTDAEIMKMFSSKFKALQDEGKIS